MIGNQLTSLLPCAAPGGSFGLDQAQELMKKEMVCPGEFAFGCVVPFEVEVPVPAGGRVVHEIKPNERLIPIAMVAYLSGPDIRIEEISRRDDRPAGLNGNGITTSRDPDTFDWESLKTHFNPFPPDVGAADQSKGFKITLSNLTGAGTQLFQATFFGAIGGYEGLKYLRAHAGLSPKLFDLLQAWLANSGIAADSAAKKG